MTYDPLDPFAPPPMTGEHGASSWDWIPSAWAQPAPPVEPAPMQPGLGIPQAAIDAAVAPAPTPEIEMANMDMRRPEPTLGFPRLVEEPAREEPLPPPSDMAPGGLQPGLGIPQGVLDQSLAAPAIADPVPLPAETGEIEFEPQQLTEADRKASLAQMSGPELAEYEAEHEEAKRIQGATSMLKAAKAEHEEAQTDLDIFRKSQAHAQQELESVKAEATQLANEKVDPDGWHDEGGPGRTIAAILMAAAGGLVQHLNGGRNIGLDMVNQSIERYIATKQADRAHKRGMLGERRAAANDQRQQSSEDFRQAAVIRAAAWERTVRLVEAEQQNYAAGGTTSLRLEKTRRAAIAEQTQADRDFAAASAKAEAEKKKQEIEEAKQAEVVRNNKAQNEASLRSAKASQTSAGASMLKARSDAKKTDAEIKALEAENTPVKTEELQRLYPNAPAEAFRIGPVSLKKFEKHLETFGKGATVGKDASEATVKAAQARLESSGPGGSPYAVSDPNNAGKAIVNKDGRPVEIKNDAERTRAKDIVTAAKNVRRYADIVKIMRADTGGASRTVGSPEYQELQSIASQIDFETFVGYGLGAPSEGDKGLAEGVRGGKDISSFIHDPSAGFEAYATGIGEKANEEMRKHGYDGPALKFDSIEAAKSLERSHTQNIEVWDSRLLKSPDLEVRKKAARVAVDGAKALAAQSEPELIKILAQQNQERFEAGLLEPAEHAKAAKEFRKAFMTKARAIEDADRARDLGLPDFSGLMKGPMVKGQSDADIDKIMGITPKAAE
jgi:hypothetical protein